MLCLKYNSEIEIKISTYLKNMLVQFIESEKKLEECNLIKEEYISKKTNINNTNRYTKLIFNIIINMDIAYKYAWSIAKLLNNGVKKYSDFREWLKDKIKVENEIIDWWDLIYLIRCEIEHPENLNTTMFRRSGTESECPKIIFKGKEYDLLELGEKALVSVFILSKAIVAVSFLYSKFVYCFTDETRTKLYKE